MCYIFLALEFLNFFVIWEFNFLKFHKRCLLHLKQHNMQLGRPQDKFLRHIHMKGIKLKFLKFEQNVFLSNACSLLNQICFLAPIHGQISLLCPLVWVNPKIVCLHLNLELAFMINWKTSSPPIESEMKQYLIPY